jgi:hypothetical protein
MVFRRQSFRTCARLISLAQVALLFMASGCGGSSNDNPPSIVLTVSLNSPVTLSQGGTIYVPVIIDAPTETATFSITGLPNGVSQSYKESESNPSGQLTLTANAQVSLGTYTPKITVGSSGQTASVVFTLVVSSAAKADDRSGAAESELKHNR